MRDFKRLTVWQRSHRLAVAIYEKTALFPKSELYGLTSQIRRACTSIPANIAEGCGRDSPADFARFLHIAGGSACEVEYYLILSADLGFLREEDRDRLLDEVADTRRMLTALVRKIKS